MGMNMSAEVITAIVAVLMGLAGMAGAATAWIKTKTETERIRQERMDTKQVRDQNESQTRDAVLKLQFEVQSLKDNQTLHNEKIEDLNKQNNVLNITLAQVLTKLDTIFEKIKELTDEAK